MPARSALTVRLDDRIFLIRGHRVMLSPDLATLYGVEPKALVQAVRRNRGRFPSDFMFQMTAKEFASLKSQFVTSNRGGIRSAFARSAWCRRPRPAVFRTSVQRIRLHQSFPHPYPDPASGIRRREAASQQPVVADCLTAVRVWRNW